MNPGRALNVIVEHSVLLRVHYNGLRARPSLSDAMICDCTSSLIWICLVFVDCRRMDFGCCNMVRECSILHNMQKKRRL
ncbi:unnamed protein product [Strongylus vulgaris]|uniref:Uncharacterized protein n=1 Tax=Strongylus vulgaris TaxID=40348 RepID=A0A3P7IZE4_STRVU|nr:unnamed protein product [Strongylus vulgaris]